MGRPQKNRLRLVVALVAVVFFATVSASSQVSIGSSPSNDSNYVTLSGTLFFNDKPLPEFQNGKAYISYKGRSNASTIIYDSKTAKYEIRRLHRSETTLFFNYYIPVEIDPNERSAMYRTGKWCGSRNCEKTLPGNYRRVVGVDISQLNDSELSHFDIDLYYIIHLLRPWDNNAIEFYTFPKDPYPVFMANDIDFEWEPVPGAVEYVLEVDVKRDPSHPAGYGRIETATTVTTAENSCTIRLEGSYQDEHYDVGISAYDADDIKIGHYMTTYKNGYGWDYRFVIDP